MGNIVSPAPLERIINLQASAPTAHPNLTPLVQTLLQLRQSTVSSQLVSRVTATTTSCAAVTVTHCHFPQKRQEEKCGHVHMQEEEQQATGVDLAVLRTN
jgi:hypothetical protein